MEDGHLDKDSLHETKQIVIRQDINQEVSPIIPATIRKHLGTHVNIERLIVQVSRKKGVNPIHATIVTGHPSSREASPIKTEENVFIGEDNVSLSVQDI